MEQPELVLVVTWNADTTGNGLELLDQQSHSLHMPCDPSPLPHRLPRNAKVVSNHGKAAPGLGGASKGSWGPAVGTGTLHRSPLAVDTCTAAENQHLTPAMPRASTVARPLAQLSWLCTQPSLFPASPFSRLSPSLPLTRPSTTCLGCLPNWLSMSSPKPTLRFLTSSLRIPA